jgi:arylsulfatase
MRANEYFNRRFSITAFINNREVAFAMSLCPPATSIPRAACVAVVVFGCIGNRLVAAESTAPPSGGPNHGPNIVLIFCDDVGYADVGCFGATGHPTPNLDRMAAEGVRFTRFYVAQPICSSSRAALMTGCYSNRVGISGVAFGPDAKVGISDKETTIAELAKQRGYATAIFGKWHLGHRTQFLPTRHGFDEYFGLPYSNDMWPQRFEPGQPEADPKRLNTYPNLPMIEDEGTKIARVTAADQDQLTTWYTEHAVSFIERHKDRPFFLYLPHSMAHVPLHVSDKFKGKAPDGLYGDVMQEIDWSVGQILAALAKNGLDDKTLVVFTSDNGPWLTYGNHGGSAGPLREGKATCWEGGVREPFIARWPGKIRSGSVCQEPAMTIDLLPTFARLMGAPLPGRPIDGLDIWPMLSGDPTAKCPHEAYYFYYQKNELHAVTSGPWKLYFPHTYPSLSGVEPGRDGKPARYKLVKLQQPELYNLVDDVGEKNNVAAQNPDVVARLEGFAERARADLGDALTGRSATGARPVGRVDD